MIAESQIEKTKINFVKDKWKITKLFLKEMSHSLVDL